MKVRLLGPQTKTRSYRSSFNNLINEFTNHTYTKENCNCENVWAPRVNVAESKNSILLEMDLPGLTDKDVKITTKEEKLNIEGERKINVDDKKEYIREEITGGKFCRSFKLPENIDNNKTDASFKNGVLSITLHKKEESKPKEVSIKIN